MRVSTADYLEVVMPHIPPPLATAEALSEIKLLTQHLPPISDGYIECRLGKGETRVDFIAALRCINLNLSKDFLNRSTWEDFVSFSKEWTQQNSDLNQIIDYVWLEFDMVDRFSQVPMPCIAFTLNPETVFDIRLREIAIESCLKFRRSSDSALFESKIQTCIDFLPSGARIAHIGAMLSRPANAVRLVIKGILTSQLIDYLEQIGWKESTNRLSQLICKISSYVTSVSLAFDLEHNIFSDIGLECFFEQPSCDGELGMQAFLDDVLIKEGLCTPKKGNSLLAWPGVSRKADCPDLWPRNLDLLDHLFSNKATSIFCRGISHIKIIYRPNGDLEAKAYLNYYHSYLELIL
jgi:hypothetical protein